MISQAQSRKVSLLGMTALVAGAVGWSTLYSPVFGIGPVTSAFVGACLGALALLWSVSLGRTGRLLPLFAVLVDLAALLFGVYVNGHLTRFSPPLDRFLAQYAPLPRAAAGGAPHPTTRPAATTTETQRVTAAKLELSQAKDALLTAKKAVFARLSVSAEYQSAALEVQQRQLELRSARTTEPAGSPLLTSATQRWTESRQRLKRLIDRYASSDPTAVAAQQNVTAAQRSLDAALSAAATSAATGAVAVRGQ